MIHKILILAASILVLPFHANADGEKVTILLKSGELIRAEVIAARYDAILITRLVEATDQALIAYRNSIERIPQESILRITKAGSSHVGTGALIGLPVGALVGALIGGSAAGDENPITGVAESLVFPWAGAALGGAAGLLLGIAVGSAASEKEQDFGPDDLSKLRSLARYSKGEPRFLRDRFPADGLDNRVQ